MPQQDDPASNHRKRGKRQDEGDIERLRQNHVIMRPRMKEQGRCGQYDGCTACHNGKDKTPANPPRIIVEGRTDMKRPAGAEPLFGKCFFHKIAHALVVTHRMRT